MSTVGSWLEALAAAGAIALAATLAVVGWALWLEQRRRQAQQRMERIHARWIDWAHRLIQAVDGGQQTITPLWEDNATAPAVIRRLQEQRRELETAERELLQGLAGSAGLRAELQAIGRHRRQMRWPMEDRLVDFLIDRPAQAVMIAAQYQAACREERQLIAAWRDHLEQWIHQREQGMQPQARGIVAVIGHWIAEGVLRLGKRGERAWDRMRCYVRHLTRHRGGPRVPQWLIEADAEQRQREAVLTEAPQPGPQQAREAA